jgi:colanic acid biosynthesis protein WcaH
MYFDQETFLKVIEVTPFVAIDLAIRNERNQILLGYRQNRPAQNFWFVPGGRIRKNERMHDALQRIVHAELGIAAPPGKLLGVYDHFYDDNFYGKPGVSTHYVVCGYQFEISSGTRFVADAQHTELKWWDLEEMLASESVHPNSKLYFQNTPGNGFQCA